jgi:nicotinamidase-related amidase
MDYKFLCVDFQNYFAEKGCKQYNGGDSIGFITDTLIPFLRGKNRLVSEIISDYRLPRPFGRNDDCRPCDFAYLSKLPDDIKSKNVWVKSMNSPIWVRKNGGKANSKTALPYQNPKKFDKWLRKEFGEPKKELTIIVFGLTLDCCVLAVCQELFWRGYQCKILTEATDPMPNKNQAKIKDEIVNGEILKHWLKFIRFGELKKLI